MNYFPAKDMLALWPDITTAGGSMTTAGSWSWLQNNFFRSNTYSSSNAAQRIALINFFSTVNRYFIGNAKTYSGWASGVFSSQSDVLFYGFNYQNTGAGSRARWGFGWNENGGGLFPSGDESSNDVEGGIGLYRSSYSAGDAIYCCQDTIGINRSARVEIYIR
jgi:hypothetical protein